MSFQHVSIRITYDVQRIFLFKKASKVASKRQYFLVGLVRPKLRAIFRNLEGEERKCPSETLLD